MPSGIDAALKSLKADAMMPAPTKVNYNGFEPEKKKKPEVTEATIDPSEIGLEKCQKIVKEQEFKIRKLKEKMAGIAPTKKNKAGDGNSPLQADGNYRAAMSYVRKDERDKRRAEREKDDEEALVGGLGKKKAAAGPSEPAPKKPAASSTEVVAVVKSAVEGSEDALAQLQKGDAWGRMRTHGDAWGHKVKKEAESFLRSMAKELAQTPEIRALADDIITSILEAANMEKATETLHRMANTTFLNTVDSCAFALLFPTVSRAMREQAHDAKMKVLVWVRIVGASVHLIADPVLLQPYLQELLPLLEDPVLCFARLESVACPSNAECLLHPTVGVQHEAAKSFGSLAFGLPEICDKDMMPFLLKKLQSQERFEEWNCCGSYGVLKMIKLGKCTSYK
eukprot:Skav234429  [mRNA]  locus=scaffold1656:174622:182997:- [translate_table: standard]